MLGDKITLISRLTSENIVSFIIAIKLINFLKNIIFDFSIYRWCEFKITHLCIFINCIERTLFNEIYSILLSSFLV